MTPDQYRQTFLLLLLLLLIRLAADFDGFFDCGDLYPRIDQLGYSQLALYVDAADLDAIRRSFSALVGPHLTEVPGKDRVVLSVLALPDD